MTTYERQRLIETIAEDMKQFLIAADEPMRIRDLIDEFAESRKGEQYDYADLEMSVFTMLSCEDVNLDSAFKIGFVINTQDIENGT